MSENVEKGRSQVFFAHGVDVVGSCARRPEERAPLVLRRTWWLHHFDGLYRVMAEHVKETIRVRRAEQGLELTLPHLEDVLPDFDKVFRPLTRANAMLEEAVLALIEVNRNEGLLDIDRIKRGAGRLDSNYRLLGEKMKLSTKVQIQYVVPDGDSWEAVGLPPQNTVEIAVPDGDGWEVLGTEPSLKEVVVNQRSEKTEVRMRLGRKQRAARSYIPKESITIVPRTPLPAPPDVVDIRAEGLTKIQELREWVDLPKDDPNAPWPRPRVKEVNSAVAKIWLGVVENVEIKTLERKIEALNAIKNAPMVAAQRKADAIQRLQELWNIKRKVRAVK